MKMKIEYLTSYWVGILRLLVGSCPMCNSDAPEVDNCPTCNGYGSSSGDQFPPAKQVKLLWWGTYKEAIDAKLRIRKLVAELRAENRRLNT